MWGANAKLHGVKCGKVLVVWGFIEPPHVIARLKKPRQRNSLPGPALVGELVAGKVGSLSHTYFSGCVTTACWCQ